jgi:mannose-6-phosphate isomerase-like protein (cupin superfamily)
MNAMVSGRYGVDSYLEWLAKEGLPVVEGYGIDLFEVEMKTWPRYGVKGAAVHLMGRGDFANMFLMELPPGGSTSPQRHLYEDVYYVLEGSGATQIELADGTRHNFEWGPKSLFAIPVNVKHRHFNASGRDRALLVTTTDLPLMLNVMHNERFIFENDFEFSERLGNSGDFAGEGEFFTVRPGKHHWETNFVPDLANIELKEWSDRGAGSSNIVFVLADGSMHAHISEIPVGSYKKGHRHFAGLHVMCVTGHGYSLLWYDINKDLIRVDWKHGVVFPPADQQFHQHFNTSGRPARYLATGVGGIRYPITRQQHQTYFGAKTGGRGKSSISVKEGGDQIEYEDQDPRIQKIWVEEMAKSGVEQKMNKYFSNVA